ncbi:MqnA/MqnD/SBP family protein [Armatimonas rosea]|uniref:1,4-dihydroxy-6-naphthoate synthase n=1 Tax=Armatimonas rosea TaxID=685828 RepID=A0A7W9W5M7_ARMRO|nr:MqnA/MqnD/SBP family protein [Armatimonas rosea]MBB6049065.1 1,4-dihydroxy-6-naphthoate synthase [Armatimonas rosea]
MTLQLCISPCPNDVYIFAGILLGHVAHPELTFETTYLDVQAANEAAATEQFDIIKVSYAAYPALKTAYELLPCGGALGRGCGPLLLKNGDAPFDPTQTVLAPGAQTTANFLLDFWLNNPPLREAGGGRRLGAGGRQYLPFDTLYEELRTVPGAQGVVIHEKRFTYEADGLTLIQDLGEFWEAQTGYAIPLGAILCRRALGLADPVAALIRESLTWADSHREQALALCREHAQDLTDGVIEAHIGLYVNAYSYDLGSEGNAAVDYFTSNWN